MAGPGPALDEVAWREHLRALRELAAQTGLELQARPGRSTLGAQQQYTAFLRSFAHKLEVLAEADGEADCVRVLRPRARSEDNACLQADTPPRREPTQADIVRLGGSQADSESQERLRRSSDCLFENFTDPVGAPCEPFLHSYLGRRRQGSLDY